MIKFLNAPERPEQGEFFGPKMALAYRLDAISQGPKNSRIPGPNPLPLALVMDMHASKNYARGCINHRCIISYTPELFEMGGRGRMELPSDWGSGQNCFMVPLLYIAQHIKNDY